MKRIIHVKTVRVAAVCLLIAAGAEYAYSETATVDPTIPTEKRAAMTTEDWRANDQFQAPAEGMIPDVRVLSPLDQSNDPEKLKLTANIRQALVTSPLFSQAAKNINIITTPDGVVTLRGRVNSETERENILGAVRQVAPGVEIRNELSTQ